MNKQQTEALWEDPFSPEMRQLVHDDVLNALNQLLVLAHRKPGEEVYTTVVEYIEGTPLAGMRITLFLTVE